MIRRDVRAIPPPSPGHSTATSAARKRPLAAIIGEGRRSATLPQPGCLTHGEGGRGQNASRGGRFRRMPAYRWVSSVPVATQPDEAVAKGSPLGDPRLALSTAEFIAILARFRVAEGDSYKNLEARTKVPNSTLYDTLSGRRKPRTEVVERL